MDSYRGPSYRGQSLPRMEDDRLLRGAGRFVDDVQLDGMLHAAVLRSAEPHALLRGIDAADALACPGVAAVYVGADLDGVVPDIGAIRREGMGGTPIPEHPVLARDLVCYVGQPVALVVAATRAQSFDARDRIALRYEPLPPLLDPRESATDASPLHPHIGTNVVMRTAAGAGNVAQAFEAADEIVEATYEIPRLAAMPMECRGIVAAPDPERRRLTVWTSTQVPHRVKTYLAALLPGDWDVRVIAPDVGGGFGRKIEVWPEEVAVAYAATQLGAPVKWTEQRSESALASHGRGFTADAQAAFRNDGRILGVRIRMLADMGAYFLTSSGGPLGNAVQRVAGPYAIPAMEVECLGVTTNRPPTGPYRGAGGPEAAVPIERIIDEGARRLGIDPAEVRRRNFIPPDAFPYETATGLKYDSGDFAPALDRAMEMAGYAALRERQAHERGPVRTGVGAATVIKASGGKAGVRKSVARVEMTTDGRVLLFTDVSPHGQGTATSFAQIAADVLGVAPEAVETRHGDTDDLAAGGGTTSSRGLAVGGNAVYTALVRMRERLDAAGGAVPPDGLIVEAEYELPANPFAFAAHIAVVELDAETGDARLTGYAAVHDCGPMINPVIVRGQIQGGVAQGVGQALSEGMRYTDAGHPLTGGFMTYGVPVAESLPPFDLDNRQTPSPTNPLGIKGIGELPTVAAPVAVANAIADALARAGASVGGLDMPLLSERVWRAGFPPSL